MAPDRQRHNQRQQDLGRWSAAGRNDVEIEWKHLSANLSERQRTQCIDVR
jgi:hypothetical protein